MNIRAEGPPPQPARRRSYCRTLKDPKSHRKEKPAGLFPKKWTRRKRRGQIETSEACRHRSVTPRSPGGPWSPMTSRSGLIADSVFSRGGGAGGAVVSKPSKPHGSLVARPRCPCSPSRPHPVMWSLLSSSSSSNHFPFLSPSPRSPSLSLSLSRFKPPCSCLPVCPSSQISRRPSPFA